MRDEKGWRQKGSDAPPIRFGSSISRGKEHVGVQTRHKRDRERLFPSSPPFGLHFPAVFLQAALSVLIKIAVALKGLSAVITGTVKKVSTRFSLYIVNSTCTHVIEMVMQPCSEAASALRDSHCCHLVLLRASPVGQALARHDLERHLVLPGLA